LLIIHVNDKYSEDTIRKICEELIHISDSGLLCSLACYVSEAVSISGLRDAHDKLLRLDKLNVNPVRSIIFSADGENLPVTGDNENAVIDMIKKYIDEHFEEEITRTELANMAFFNPSYLSRLFKKKLGVSISDYITNVRIEKSKQLLTGNDSIGNISMNVGYYNMSHFSRMFKKNVGMSPQEYRRKMKS